MSLQILAYLKKEAPSIYAQIDKSLIEKFVKYYFNQMKETSVH